MKLKGKKIVQITSIFLIIAVLLAVNLKPAKASWFQIQIQIGVENENGEIEPKIYYGYKEKITKLMQNAGYTESEIDTTLKSRIDARFGKSDSAFKSGQTKIDAAIGSVIDKAVDNIATSANNITTEMTKGLIEQGEYLVPNTVDAVTNAIVGSFAPDLSWFQTQTGGSPTEDGPVVSMFIYYAKIFGATLSTLMFLVSLLIMIFNGGNQKDGDSPVRLVIMYILSLFLITWSPNIMQETLTVFQNVWNHCLTLSTETEEKQLSGSDFNLETDELSVRAELAKNTVKSWWSIITAKNDAEKDAALQEKNEWEQAYKDAVTNSKVQEGYEVIAGIQLPRNDTLSFLYSIVKWFLMWQLLKSFIRLFLENAEQYMVMVIMVLLSPIAFSLIVSKRTANSLISFLNMFLTEIFLLITNTVFIRGMICIVVNGYHKSDFMGYIFLMAYLRTAQRLDSYLYGMGLNVAQTGSGLLDAARLDTGAVIGAFIGLNGLRKGTAGLIKNAAMAVGSPAAYKAASKFGMSNRDINMAGGISKVGSTQQMLQNIGKLGNKVAPGTIKAKDAANAIGRYMNNPNPDNLSAVRALDDKSLTSALQTYAPNGMKINGIKGAANGAFAVDGKMNGINVSGSISKQQMTGKSINTGNGSYFTPTSTLSKGDMIGIKSPKDFSAAMLANGMPPSGIGTKPYTPSELANAQNIATNAAVTRDKALSTGNYDEARKAERTYNAAAASVKQMETSGVVSGVRKVGENGIAAQYVDANGVALGSVSNNGDSHLYSRYKQDSGILAKGKQLSKEQQTKALFEMEYKGDWIEYDPNAIGSPKDDLAKGFASMSEQDRVNYGIDNNNGGYGFNANMEYDPGNNKMRLHVQENDYDFTRDELNKATPDWEVLKNAEPRRVDYGKYEMDAYNIRTNESGVLTLSSTDVYPEERGGNTLEGRHGDSYRISGRVIKEEKPNPEKDFDEDKPELKSKDKPGKSPTLPAKDKKDKIIELLND